MRSVPLAMTWELFSNGRWGLLAAILGAHAMPGLLLTALRFEGVDSGDESMVIIHVVIMLINALCLAAAIMTAQGNPSRLYAFPVSTATLVAWQMLPAMATLFAESALSTMALNAVYKLDWPVWGPALFVTCALAAVQGVLWLTEKSAWLLLGMTAVGGLLGTWIMSRYGLVLTRPPHLWREVTPAEILAMLSVAIVSYGLAVVGVGRDRCGEALRSEALKAWFERLLDPAPAFGQPFRTPLAAQFWCEWRQKGALPWMFAFVLFVGFCGWVLFNRDPRLLHEGCLTAGYFLPIVGFVMGLVIGTTGPADGKFEMSQFLATRPITISDLSRMILKTAVLNVLGGWLVWSAAALVVSLALWTVNALPHPLLPAEMHWWHFPATLVGTWLTTALMTCLILCGHQRFLGSFFFGTFGLIILGTLFGKWGLSEADRVRFHQAVLMASALVYVLATAWAFIKARRRAMIQSQTVAISAAAWVIAVGFVSLNPTWRHATTIPVQIQLAGLAALALAPLAVMPLALAWNRHR
ncbi:MAG TPA: hypothetical protein VGM05_26210 [Planctomycetaceae bacterium]|jgi:hypothetical protein